MDLVMFRPRGFFLETEDDLRDMNELEEVDEEVSSAVGMDLEVEAVGRRRDKGESDMVVEVVEALGQMLCFISS